MSFIFRETLMAHFLLKRIRRNPRRKSTVLLRSSWLWIVRSNVGTIRRNRSMMSEEFCCSDVRIVLF
nr:MAG TPA: hypothetical protein [Caudoviricetes sp.]